MLLHRRDNSTYTRDIYGKIIKIILNNCTFDDAFYVLENGINNLLKGNISINDLTINKRYHDTYNTENFYMKIFSDSLKAKGNIINNGEMLSFIIVDNPFSDLLGNKMILVADYLNDYLNYQIDHYYYINLLLKSVNELFITGNLIDKSQYLSYNNGFLELIDKLCD